MTTLMDFVREHGGNEEIVVKLIQDFIEGYPPGVSDVDHLPERHRAYAEKIAKRPLAIVMQTIYERERWLTKRSAMHH